MLLDEGLCVNQFKLSSVVTSVEYKPASSGAHLETTIRSMKMKGLKKIPIIEDYEKGSEVLSFKFDLNPLHNEYDYGKSFSLSSHLFFIVFV